MAPLDYLNIPAAFEGHLEPGEELKHWAYGEKAPMVAIFGLLVGLLAYLFFAGVFLSSVLPGLVLLILFVGVFLGLRAVMVSVSKAYLAGLTDRRFLVLRVKMRMNGKIDVGATMGLVSYDLAKLPRTVISTGPAKNINILAGLRKTVLSSVWSQGCYRPAGASGGHSGRTQELIRQATSHVRLQQR